MLDLLNDNRDALLKGVQDVLVGVRTTVDNGKSNVLTLFVKAAEMNNLLETCPEVSDGVPGHGQLFVVEGAKVVQIRLKNEKNIERISNSQKF